MCVHSLTPSTTLNIRTLVEMGAHRKPDGTIQNLLSASHLVQEGKSIVLRWTLDAMSTASMISTRTCRYLIKLEYNNHLKKDKEARRNHSFDSIVKNHQRSLYGLVRLACSNGKETRNVSMTTSILELG